MVHKLLKRIQSGYFSYWAILVIDTCISVLSTALAYFSVISLIDDSNHNISRLHYILLGSFIASLTAFFILNTFKRTIRYVRAKDLTLLTFSALLKILFCGILIYFFPKWNNLSHGGFMTFIIFDAMLTIIGLIGIRIIMIVVYEWMLKYAKPSKNTKLLIYGVSIRSVSLEMRLRSSKSNSPIGFLIHGSSFRSYRLAGLPVYNFKTEEDFLNIVNKHHIQGVLFAQAGDVVMEKERLIRFCEQAHLKTLIAPEISSNVEDASKNLPIRNINIEDLLGREVININKTNLIKNFKDKVVLITGAAGSIGSEMCCQLAELGVKQLVLFDIAETPLHNLRLKMAAAYPNLNFTAVIGDIRVKRRLEMVFNIYHPEIIIHAAAYKHVPLMEENPCEAVLVNVIGTRFVADMAVKNGVKRMIMVSTDKAVNPTNVMGASKRLAEIYVQSLGAAIEEGEIAGATQFITTRFGNVLGSNGSVIPRFKEQIENREPITVTHPDIIRYFMTIPEACNLVLEAAIMGESNEIFAFHMGEPIKIADLARRMITLSGLEPDVDVKIEYTGLRPGEKLYEEVLSSEENSVSTYHEKINIAKVRKYNYNEILRYYDEFFVLSQNVEIERTVALMKKMLPEYVSQNSKFEFLDKIREVWKSENGQNGEMVSVVKKLKEIEADE